MGRKTGPFLGGVFLPDDAVVSVPIDPAISEQEFLEQLARDLQEPCDECSDAIADCECGAEWLGEPEH